jgi:hypothetical protein
MDRCGICRYSKFLGDAVGPSWILAILHLCILGSLDVCLGKSSTQTLFLRVMDTFDDDDDDDDDFNTSTLQHFNILKPHLLLTFKQ